MQNSLLKDLFPNHVPPRVPLDPKNVVVELEKHVLLASYFEKDTPWGRHKAEIEEEVRNSFSAHSK
jgi:hypothetical protein